jgi:uncharacterized protein involved in tolerance to divalent cations
MVNVIIYLNKSLDAKELVDTLLRNQLIANASIDCDNVSYQFEGDQIIESIKSVITAQTKSMLFSQIETFIQQKYEMDVPIYSLPLTQVSVSFDALIRSRTQKI